MKITQAALFHNGTLAALSDKGALLIETAPDTRDLRLGPDDTTYVGVAIHTGLATVTSGTVEGAAASFAANGQRYVYLSPGEYRWHLA